MTTSQKSIESYNHPQKSEKNDQEVDKINNKFTGLLDEIQKLSQTVKVIFSKI